jgi:hypothetical protein
MNASLKEAAHPTATMATPVSPTTLHALKVHAQRDRLLAIEQVFEGFKSLQIGEVIFYSFVGARDTGGA